MRESSAAIGLVAVRGSRKGADDTATRSVARLGYRLARLQCLECPSHSLQITPRLLWRPSRSRIASLGPVVETTSLRSLSRHFTRLGLLPPLILMLKQPSLMRQIGKRSNRSSRTCSISYQARVQNLPSSSVRVSYSLFIRVVQANIKTECYSQHPTPTSLARNQNCQAPH
jgi:hypothetical protein